MRFTSVMGAMKCRFICEVFSLWAQFIFFVWRPQILHIPDSVPPPSIYDPLKVTGWKRVFCRRRDFWYLSTKRYRIVWFMFSAWNDSNIYILLLLFFGGGGGGLEWYGGGLTFHTCRTFNTCLWYILFLWLRNSIL